MILFLYGDDSFRSRMRLAEYKERFAKKYGPQGDLIMIDAEEKKDIEFSEIIGSRGLFSSVRLVIIKNYLSREDAEKQKQAVEFFKLNKYIAAGKDIILIFWEKDFSRKENSLFKYFQRSSKVEQFPKLAGARLTHWIIERLNEINPKTKIGREAIEKLIAYTAGETQLIASELEKLAAFKESGEITGDDVDQLVTAKISTTIFETIESASGGNKKRALELLHGKLENRKDAFYILSMYAYQFRNIMKIGELYWQGMANHFDIAKKTRLHPFVVQKTLPQLKNFSLERLKNIYRSLQKIDIEAKTGKIDIQLALDKFIVEL